MIVDMEVVDKRQFEQVESRRVPPYYIVVIGHLPSPRPAGCRVATQTVGLRPPYLMFAIDIVSSIFLIAQEFFHESGGILW